jgi:pSer/pThr/pTyr-binding forkhead associated (FHA) protein
MITCSRCGHHSLEGEAYCPKCGVLLLADVPDRNATRRLEQAEKIAARSNWGTAQLGNERLLLLHLRGYDQPVVVRLTDHLVIGRTNSETGETPEVILDDFGAKEQGVSRRHAILLNEDNAVKVMDLGSANATYMNGQKLIAHQARILRDGDELRLGNLVIRITFG